MKDKKEQIKALKVAFFDTELDQQLIDKILAIYNTFDDKQFDIRHQK
jgi:hypothetical protein